MTTSNAADSEQSFTVHVEKNGHFHDTEAYLENVGGEQPIRPSGLTASLSGWRVAESLLALRRQIDDAFPNRNKAHDGTIGDTAHCPGKSDHCPNILDNGQGVVTAFDVSNDPDNGCDANKIVEAMITSRDERIKYIIWNKRICSSIVSPWKWRDYQGSNPHTAHAHISVIGSKALYDDTSPWAIGEFQEEPEFTGALSPVYNRGVAPESFLKTLVDWAKTANDAIFDWAPNYDIYSHVRQDLGPWRGINHRKAVMLEVLRVLAGYESSWDWSAGHNINNPDATTDCTKEAGIFQCTGASLHFDPALLQLLIATAGRCDCATFRTMTRENPSFALEYCARLLRVTVNHHSTIKRREIHPWLRRDSVQEFERQL